MIKLNNIPVTVQDYKAKILPYFHTEDEKKQAEQGETIYRDAKKYFHKLPSFGEVENDFYEELLQKYLYNEGHPIKDIEASHLTYLFMGNNWYFSGISELDKDNRFIIRIGAEDNYDVLKIETDVLEYGLIAGIDIVKQLNKEKEPK